MLQKTTKKTGRVIWKVSSEMGQRRKLESLEGPLSGKAFFL